MKISLEEKKIEAIERLKILKVPVKVIWQFSEKGIVNISEPVLDAFIEVNDTDKKRIADFEEINSALVYSVIRSHYEDFGTMDSYFFVSDYKNEEWAIDRKDLRHNQTLSYVYNHNEPVFSEFGTIGFEKTRSAALRRIW